MSRLVEIVLLIILAVGAGGAGGYYAATNIERGMDDAPVAVVDVKEYIERAITGPKGELLDDQVSTGIQQAMDAAKALSDRGFIVLDRQSVLAAPEKYHVAPPSASSDAEPVAEKESN